MLIGRTYIFDPAREGMEEAARLARVEHGFVEVRDEDIYGARIRRGYFITSNWPANDRQGMADPSEVERATNP